MRNLKRALSLGLSSAMVLGTMAFSASAADLNVFTDSDQINNTTAASIVHEIGLMVGKDSGAFGAQDIVSRAEMAVFCTTMMYGPAFDVDQYVDTNQFSDVSSTDWYVNYVNLAHSEGIIAGYGDGTFGPLDEVTTSEAMLMVLKTLGYFQNTSEFKNNWQLAVTEKATALNLYKGEDDADMSLKAEQGLIRDDVVAILFNALTRVVPVDYNPSFGAYYNRGGNMTMGVDNSVVEDTYGMKTFELRAHYDVDEFNRPATTWMHGNKNIGTYSDAATYTYTSGLSEANMYTALGSTIMNGDDSTYEYSIMVDGAEVAVNAEEFKSYISRTSTDGFYQSGNGVLTEVFIVSPIYYTTSSDGKPVGSVSVPGKVTITQIHSYVAEVNTCVSNDDEYVVTVRYENNDLDIVGESNDDSHWQDVDTVLNYTVIETDKEFEKGDVVVITASAADVSGGSKKVVSIELADTVEGMATGAKVESGITGGSWLSVDDVQFDYAKTMRGELTDDNSDGAMAPTTNDEITAYLDAYGYVMTYKIGIAEPEFVYITNRGSFDLGDAKVEAVFADGSKSIIQVSQLDGETITESEWADNMPSNVKYTDKDGDTSTAGDNYWDNNGVSDTQAGRIFAYRLLDDGTYNLKTKDLELVEDDGSEEDGVPGLANDNEQIAEDTMAIYNSNRFDASLSLAGDNTYDVDDMDAAVSTPAQVLANTDTFGKTGNTVFEIKKGEPAVYYVDAETKNDPTVAFKVDNNTIFIDVHSGDHWHGMSEVPNMGGSSAQDLNMQVIFGNGGIADVVYINNGAPAEESGDYVFLKDTDFEWTTEAGDTIYTYTCYVDGYETTFSSKGAQVDVVDMSGKSLEVSTTDTGIKVKTTYLISKQDANGYVTEIMEIQDYSDYLKYTAGSGDWDNDNSAKEELATAKTVGNGTLELNKDDTSWNEDSTNEASIFSFDADTVFVILTATSSSYNVAAGSASDINEGASYVDVISASGDIDATPYAKLVFVVQPFGSGEGSNKEDETYVTGAFEFVYDTSSKTGTTKDDALPFVYGTGTTVVSGTNSGYWLGEINHMTVGESAWEAAAYGEAVAFTKAGLTSPVVSDESATAAGVYTWKVTGVNSSNVTVETWYSLDVSKLFALSSGANVAIGTSEDATTKASQVKAIIDGHIGLTSASNSILDGVAESVYRDMEWNTTLATLAEYADSSMPSINDGADYLVIAKYASAVTTSGGVAIEKGTQVFTGTDLKKLTVDQLVNSDVTIITAVESFTLTEANLNKLPSGTSYTISYGTAPDAESTILLSDNGVHYAETVTTAKFWLVVNTPNNTFPVSNDYAKTNSYYDFGAAGSVQASGTTNESTYSTTGVAHSANKLVNEEGTVSKIVVSYNNGSTNTTIDVGKPAEAVSVAIQGMDATLDGVTTADLGEAITANATSLGLTGANTTVYVRYLDENGTQQVVAGDNNAVTLGDLDGQTITFGLLCDFNNVSASSETLGAVTEIMYSGTDVISADVSDNPATFVPFGASLMFKIALENVEANDAAAIILTSTGNTFGVPTTTYGNCTLPTSEGESITILLTNDTEALNTDTISVALTVGSVGATNGKLIYTFDAANSGS